MKRIALFASLVAALTCGCRSTSTLRYVEFSEWHTKHWKEVAMQAASSPEVWQRLRGQRLTTKPLRLDASQVSFQIHYDAGEVYVMIPSGGRLGEHHCFVGVSLRRYPLEVVRIEENCWP